MEMQNLLSNDLVDMDNDTINYWMPRFLLEVSKLNGLEYPPNSIYQMICGLQHHLQQSRPGLSLFSSMFAIMQRTLDAKMKQLRSSGLGVEVKKAESITIEEEEVMWQCGALDDQDPRTLLYTIFYLIGVYFAL